MASKNIFSTGELNILDGESESLSAVLSQKLATCTSLDILVGYFYFDGLQTIRQALEANKHRVTIRILVGMEAGVDTRRIVEYAQRQELLSDSDKRERYLQSLKDVVAALGPANDNSDSHKIATLYSEMIDAGRLKISRTHEQNHSKLYLFHYDDPSEDCYIVGSSNFSCPGILTRNELNVHIQRVGVGHMTELFKKLWDDALPLTQFKEGSEEPVSRTIRKETKFGEIAPFDAYLMIMQRYLKMYEGKENPEHISLLMQSAKGDYTPYKYQVDAVSRALTILRRSNGVLIADVVGLGKSVVAATIAKARSGPGIMLCPPHLLSEWLGYEDEQRGHIPGYFEQFGLDKTGWTAFSMYQLNEVKKHIATCSPNMVIIDEAHRFRNRELDRYSDLCDICANRKVVLLTATPFNNRPRDIHALLGLFTDPNVDCAAGGRFKDTMEKLDKDYLAAMSDLKTGTVSRTEVQETLKRISRQTFQVMRDVTVRRNRIDLRKHDDYRHEIANSLSKQMPPLVRSYRLSGETELFFEKVLTEYFGGATRFKGAIYKPAQYLKGNEAVKGKFKQDEQTQSNYYGMLCRFLVNRFESSFAAFKKSIESVRDYAEQALKTLDNEGILVLSRELFRRLDRPDADDFATELRRLQGAGDNGPLSGKKKKRKTLDYKKDQLDIDRFRLDTKADIDLLNEILETIKRLKLLSAGRDPKLEAAIEEIRQVLENSHTEIKSDSKASVRKVVVFSGFADTVSYIGERIASEFPGRTLVVVGNARAEDETVQTLDETVRTKIKTNFDAKNGDPNSPLQVLVATDTISEGLNLNLAGLVINYDIPWNPVRVIQRIGRINRISKKVFDNIYVMNLFPSDAGERVVGKVGRVKTKLQMIHEIVREDAQILDTDETPRSADLAEAINKAPQQNEKNNQSEETAVRERMDAIKKAFITAHGENAWIDKLKDLSGLPLGMKVVAQQGNSYRLTVFKDNGLMISALSIDDIRAKEPSVIPICFEDALGVIACDVNAKASSFAQEYWDAYEKVLAYRPYQPTKSTANRWRRASNVLRTESFYRSLDKDLRRWHQRMLNACEDNLLKPAELKRLVQVRTPDDLKQVVQDWADTKRLAGANEAGIFEGVAMPNEPILAFGTTPFDKSDRHGV